MRKCAERVKVCIAQSGGGVVLMLYDQVRWKKKTVKLQCKRAFRWSVIHGY